MEKLKRKIEKKFDECTRDTTAFLSTQSELSVRFKSILKGLYDSSRVRNEAELPPLVVREFDTEQIWQQLVLLNGFDGGYDGIDEIVQNPKFEALKYEAEDDAVCDPDDESDSDNDDEIEDEEKIEEEDSDEDKWKENGDEFDKLEEEEEEEDESEGDREIEIAKKLRYSSEVDDKFFKLAEMEDFLLREEKLEGKNGKLREDEIDYFGEIPSGDEENYTEFFGSEDKEGLVPKKGKRSVRFDLPEKEESTEEEEEKITSDVAEDDYEDSGDKSTFEKRQKRIRERVKRLEADSLKEKPWPMTGEVTARKRPQNSLLEEVLEFDLTSRPAPIITEEVAVKLEDVIMRRIKDKAWDDVERQIKPVDTPFQFKKRLALDQEKSKLSLAQIYEQDYVNQRESMKKKSDGGGAATGDEEQVESKDEKQIKQMMNHLFHKLDALSNYFFTPKMAVPELQIVSNLPAISMEEAIPVTVSDATLLAPEEIQGKRKGNLLGKEERTSTDKNRERRRKKAKQKFKRLEIEKREKMLEKLKKSGSGKGGRGGTKYSEEKIKKELRRLTESGAVIAADEKRGKMTSSKKFFDELQNNVTNQEKSKMKRKKSISGGLNAKKIKF